MIDTNKELPEGWVETTLGDIAKWSSGGTPSRSNPKYYGGDIPWIKTGDLNDDIVHEASEFITEEGLNNSSAKLFPKGSVAIAMYGATIGKTGIFNIEAATNQACAVGIPIKCGTNFLFYYLKSQKQNFIDLGKGGAQPNISQSVIKEYKLNLPPLEEQNRIVAKLDQLFAHLETAKKGLDKIPTLLKVFRQAVLTQAVTGKLTEEWREGKGVEDAELMPLSKLGIWKGGGTPSKNKKEYWVNGNIPWITAKDMKSNFLDTSMDKITDEGLKKSSAILIPKNSILIVTRSGILRRILPISMNIVDATVNQDLKVLIPKSFVDSKFLLYSLIGNEELIRTSCMKSGTTVESIEFTLLKDFCIRIPHLEEQTEIVRRVEGLFAKADAIEERYKSLKEKIERLPQAILGKAFRGEL